MSVLKNRIAVRMRCGKESEINLFDDSNIIQY